MRYEEFGDAIFNAGSQNAQWIAEIDHSRAYALYTELHCKLTPHHDNYFQERVNFFVGSIDLATAAGLKPRALSIPRLVCIIAVLGKAVHFYARDSLSSYRRISQRLCSRNIKVVLIIVNAKLTDD